MKITIEALEKKYSIQTDYDDVLIDEYIDYMINLLICVGFNRETIIDYLKQI